MEKFLEKWNCDKTQHPNTGKVFKNKKDFVACENRARIYKKISSNNLLSAELFFLRILDLEEATKILLVLETERGKFLHKRITNGVLFFMDITIKLSEAGIYNKKTKPVYSQKFDLGIFIPDISGIIDSYLKVCPRCYNILRIWENFENMDVENRIVKFLTERHETCPRLIYLDVAAEEIYVHPNKYHRRNTVKIVSDEDQYLLSEKIQQSEF